MKQFPLLIKPASGDCNLQCEYCFYAGHPDSTKSGGRHRMPDAVLEKMIKSYMATAQAEYVFTWQGGEPTLMGVDFFRRAVELQIKYGGTKNAVVGNGIQTNGIGITAELARLMADYLFLAGVSLDGPVEFHDRFRRTAAGQPTHADAMRGIRLLKDHGVDFNILILVNKANVRHAKAVFRFLVDNGFMYQQYVPCVEPTGAAASPFSISGEEWGAFLCELFDEWKSGCVNSVSIRLFDAIVKRLVDGGVTLCTMGGDCRSYFVIEYNGDVYPCDFFVESSLKIGNVATGSFESMLQSDVYRSFGLRKQRRNLECGPCRWESLCMGDCQKHRLAGGAREPGALSLLCGGWKMFYAHSMGTFTKLAGEIGAR